MHTVLWSPVGAPAGVPGPRRNADECDAGWFAPVATRRRPLLPDFQSASLWLAVFSGGIPPGPHVALPSRLRPHWSPTPGLAAPSDGLVLGSLHLGLVGRLRVALPAAVPPSPTVWGASSRGAAGGAEGVFAGRCGLGAASSLRMRL